MGRSFHQGKFAPVNPEKYRGNVHNIVYRSSWELKAMTHFDLSPAIAAWSSEEVVVPYFDQSTNRQRRYFVDFWVAVRQKDGSVKKFLVEVKPAAETVLPKPPGNRSSPKSVIQFQKRAADYVRNQCKWQAAKLFCEANGWGFIVATEHDLKIGKPKKGK